jgi:tetratricopeptide (TPR) repeat protein
MPLVTLALLLAAAAPVSAVCTPPSQTDDASAIVHKIGGCFNGSEAAEVQILNLCQTHIHDRDAFVEKYRDYIINHKIELAHYQLSPNGGYAENVHNPEILPTNLAVATLLAGALYDKQAEAYGRTSRQQPPAAPETTARPATTVKDPGPSEKSAASTPAPPTTAEDISVQVAAVTGDPITAKQAASLAAERQDFALAYSRYSAVPQDPQHPDADAEIGAADAAYRAGDFAAAHAAAAAALQARPGDKTALTILHFSDGRTPKVDLRGAAAGFGVARAPEGAPRGAAVPTRTAVAQTAPPAFAPLRAALDPRAAHEDESAATALKLGDLDAAIAHATRALALDPRDENAYLYRSKALGRQNRWAGAESDAAQALALAPDDPAALLAHIAALEAQGRWQEALSDADRLIRVDGGRAAAHRTRARILAEMRDRAGALSELSRAAAIDPSFRPMYERAVQLPQDQDLSLVFSGGEATPAPAEAPRRPLRAAFVATGALLLAAGVVAAVMFFRRRRSVAAPEAARLHGRYEVVRRIGAGGMGVVDEARDLALGRRVAIKRIRDENSTDAKERGRFLQEARAVARLNHDGIVQVYEVYEDGRDACVVFEFVDGRTLHEHATAKPGGLGFSAALALLRPVCAAVEHAHAAGLVHRDLKPANMMIDGAGRVKVMDFGAARPLSAFADDRMTSTIIGTPPYMAPEQEQGVVRRESDVYALAVSLYEVATGRFPFDGAGPLLSQKKLEGKPRPAEGIADVPAGFDAAMTAALAPDPEKRPRTPSELLASFDALIRARA